MRGEPRGIYEQLWTGVSRLGGEENGNHLRNENARTISFFEDTPSAERQPLRFGDLCPECGEAAVVNEEGCRKCYACGYSEC